MHTLSEIRKELAFQKSFLALIENLKLVSIENYYKTKQLDDFYTRIIDELKKSASFMRFADIKSPYLQSYSPTKAYIVLTPDSGLMGGLNNRVIQAYEYFASHAEVEPVTIVLGEKGAHAIGANSNVIPFLGYKETLESISEKVNQIKEYICQAIDDNKIGGVDIVYPASLSFSRQEVRIESLLPCQMLIDENKPTFSDKRRIEIESSSEDLAKYLASYWLNIKLYMAFKDAKLAEYSARAVHMNGCESKLERELEVTKKKLSDLRKELIDKQMREIATVKGLIKKKKDFLANKQRQNNV